MSNPLTETCSQFKARKFNQGKIDGFAEVCELVERQFGWLTKDVFSILLLLFRVYVLSPMLALDPELEYMKGYILGNLLAYYYLCRRDIPKSKDFGFYLFTQQLT